MKVTTVKLNWIRIKGLTLIAVSSCWLSGCSDSDRRLPTHQVQGRVVIANQPVRFASVVLHPLQANQGETIRPRGTTDETGKFQLTTYESGDGAPEGEYRVTIEQWTTDKPDEGPKNRLNRKYSDPNSSGLTASIQGGATNLRDLQIKR